MIRLTCPGCQSHLNAKEELVGQTRKCPKCGTDIVIVAPAATSEPVADESSDSTAASPDQDASIVVEQPLPTFRGPERLTRLNQYVICNNTAVVAAWQNNGRGWMLHAPAGFISAARNNEKIPTSGTFQLVELQMQTVDDALRLAGLFVYRLANRWSLMTLNRGDDAILATVSAAGSLNRDQKAAVREHLREHVMRAIWENAEAVLEYLGNVDYHSPGVSPATSSDPPAAPTSDGP